jgi:predicted acylesterase/phospholipase RssA
MSHLNYLFFLILMIWPSGENNTIKNKLPINQSGKPEGTAIIITGAAARIPQEAALLENLYNKDWLGDVQFIAGASSGALNTVMLNSILTKKITWERYLNLLFNLKNEDIYLRNGKKLPVDTKPLRNFLQQVVNNTIGYHKIGDLPIPSAISIANVELITLIKKSFRMSNIKINPESDPNLDLVEILMASTSFPIAFPPARINNAFTLPDRPFIDGGVGEDHVPFKGMLEYIRSRGKSFEKVIIVSRKADKQPELSEELRNLGINDKGLLDKLGISLDEILFRGFIKGLERLQKEDPDLAERTFIYVPDFQEDFLLFDFNNLRDQYDVTRKWASNHLPVPMKQYLQSVVGKEQ